MAPAWTEAAAERTPTASPVKAQASHNLPDSVLAVVGSDRQVTTRDLARAAYPTPVDSLTPADLARFLDLLIDREVVAERASSETWGWTADESRGYEALRDRLLVAAALDSILQSGRAKARNAGHEPPEDRTLGILLRDSLVAGMNVAFDDACVARLARAWALVPRPTSDSSAAAQVRMLAVNPRIDPTDSAAVLARSDAGDYRVSELLDSWRRLSPAYRPHIDSAEQIRDLVRNGLFERMIREKARAGSFERRADVAATLARARDEIATTHLIEREVYARIHPEPSQIERDYRDHRDAWKTEPRARILRLLASSRGEAGRFALELHDPATAESLTTRARRRGLEFISEVDAKTDSALFAEATRAGAGVVLPPRAVEGGWSVTRVVSILPARVRSLDEVRPEIARRLYAQSAERRLEELCRRWRRSMAIEVHARARERASDPTAGGP